MSIYELKHRKDKTVDQHLEKASVELTDFYKRIDIGIRDICSKIECYSTNREIIYRSSINFVYLQVQTNKNRLKLYLRSINGIMNDPKGLTKTSRPLGSLDRQLYIAPYEEKIGKFSINDIMFLIRQSYDKAQL